MQKVSSLNSHEVVYELTVVLGKQKRTNLDPTKLLKRTLFLEVEDLYLGLNHWSELTCGTSEIKQDYKEGAQEEDVKIHILVL